MPISNQLDLAVLGKAAEEASEFAAIVARCIIQGPYECDPESGKINRSAMMDEIADVRAQCDILVEHFRLNEEYINKRTGQKTDYLHEWHRMILEELYRQDFEEPGWLAQVWRRWRGKA